MKVAVHISDIFAITDLLCFRILSLTYLKLFILKGGGGASCLGRDLPRIDIVHGYHKYRMFRSNLSNFKN